jgi:uncharacterized protein (TIGR03790 family)
MISRHLLRIALSLILTFGFCGFARAAEESLAPKTIVVYNRDLPESVALAKFYAEKRGIARDHLVPLSCSKEEEISREEYDTTIADPLRAVFKERQWWKLRENSEQPEVIANSIRFVALIKGVPLKIRAATAYPGDKASAGEAGNRNEASVDSELAILGTFRREISGAVNNVYFQSYLPIVQFKGPVLMLVCRLDAPDASTARRMIVDAIETEKSGLWGRAYIDSAYNQAPGLAVGDDWLSQISAQLRKAGVPVTFERTQAIFPDGYPVTDCALYYGWYAGAVAGPFAQPDFRFVPGAVAVHIHSFSAATLRDPNAAWVGPLVSKGAAASLGNVYEPYLQFTAHLGIFNDRLLHGFTFAESAYISTRALSWMSVMVGDPLYRPYALWNRIDLKEDASKTSSPWQMAREFARKNSSKPPAEFRTLARQAASRGRNCPMIEDLGAQEAQEGNFASATNYFLQARACYTKRDDILRVVLEEAEAWIKQGKPKRALELVRSVLRIISDAPASALLKKIERELAPPPAPSPTPRAL